jgi:membrane protease YdiL (CAAX protease family)
MYLLTRVISIISSNYRPGLGDPDDSRRTILVAGAAGGYGRTMAVASGGTGTGTGTGADADAGAGVPAAAGAEAVAPPAAGRVVAGGGPVASTAAAGLPAAPNRRQLAVEVLCVLGVSLGASAFFAVIRYIGVLTAEGPVRAQVARLNSSAAPGRPWLDLALQVASLLTAVVPALLAAHLLGRCGGGLAAVGLARPTSRRLRRDVAAGALLAATVGGAGIVVYLLAWQMGVNVTVAPSNLPAVWWRIPVLIASAVQNGVVEEVVVVGYLLVRLRAFGWSEPAALAASALLRGAYHLYQGLGGFVGNLAMGLLFARIFQRTGRVAPLVVAHSLIDVVAFVGYVLLAGRVPWLPRG